MRCFICDSVLQDSEIKVNPDHQDFDPCGTCLEIIEEVFEPLDEEEIRRQIEIEWDLTEGAQEPDDVEES